MNSGIKTFIAELLTDITVKLSVFDEEGQFIVGEGKATDTVNITFSGVYSDVNLKRTLFRFKYKNTTYIGKIEGAGKTERNYAYLISSLAVKEIAKEVNLSKEEFFRAVIFGEVSYLQLEKYAKRYCPTIRPACVMIITGENGKSEETLNVLTNYCSGDQDFAFSIDDDRFALVKFADESTGEYHSFNEYAEFLAESLYEEAGVKVSIAIGGTVKAIADLAVSFTQAVATERMGDVLDSRAGVHSFKEYILSKMLEDLPKYKLNEYLELLMDFSAKEIFNDKEMTDTAEGLLENNLNISETARKLFLHRNTLNYRLDKIERSTGLDIRKFSDAMTFRLIVTLSRLVD